MSRLLGPNKKIKLFVNGSACEVRALAFDSTSKTVVATSDAAVLSTADGVYYVPSNSDFELETQLELVKSLQLMPDEGYFDITTEGLVSLKPEYRGAVPDTLYMYAISDAGLHNAGSKINELPRRLVVPHTINYLTVTGLQPGAFYFNTRPVELVLPAAIESVDKDGFRGAVNLINVSWIPNSSELGDTI